MVFPSVSHSQNVKKYNLLFNNPALGSESSMVLGNGDISANAWVDKRDHNLYFYIGKTDSRDYLDRLLKVGKLKVQFEPNISKDEVSYKQEFHLDKSLLTIQTANPIQIIRYQFMQKILTAMEKRSLYFPIF